MFLVSSCTAKNIQHGRGLVSVQELLELVAQSGPHNKGSTGDAEKYEGNCETELFDSALSAPLAMLFRSLPVSA